jgi:hypothetical protein
MRVKFLLFLSIMLTPCTAQDSGISLSASEIGEGKLARRVTFDGNSLWGYINGGADLYLEYGFRNITVHEIEYNGNTLRFDLYRMNDPKAAYGIFSIYTYNCDSDEGPGQFNCGTKWQLQTVKGDYYLSAILSAGTVDEFTYASRIAASLLAKINADEFEPGFPFISGAFENLEGKVRYGRGSLSLDNGISVSAAIRGRSLTDLWQISDIPEYEGIVVTAITFASGEERESFHTVLSATMKTEEDESRTYLLDDGSTILIMEGTGALGSPDGILKWFSGIRN